MMTESIPPRRIGLKDLKRRLKAAHQHNGFVKMATVGVVYGSNWSPEQIEYAMRQRRIANVLVMTARMDLEIRLKEIGE